MTKDEMTTLLRSVSCDENTITAMENAFEMGFEHGGNVTETLKNLVEEAQSICLELDETGFANTIPFWVEYNKLKAMQ